MAVSADDARVLAASFALALVACFGADSSRLWELFDDPLGVGALSDLGFPDGLIVEGFRLLIGVLDSAGYSAEAAAEIEGVRNASG